MTKVAILADHRPPATTPEGKQSLRSIACSPLWSEDDPREARRWLGPQVIAALPLALREAEAMLAPATMADAKRFLGPTLTMVAPASMSENDRVEWLAAALDTLSGIPADLLERGCRAARQTIDHPSKIVSTIFAEIGSTWESRKRDRSNVRRIAELARAKEAECRPWEREDAFDPATRCAPDAAARIIEEFSLRRQEEARPRRHDGAPRAPTEADYIEIMGAAAWLAARAAGTAPAMEAEA